MTDTPFINVCVPVYYGSSWTPIFLDRLLTSIEAQDYPQSQIMPVLSVQDCTLDQHGELASVIRNRATVIHAEKDIDGPAKNTSNAMAHAFEGYIKIMNQDDFLDGTVALREMVEAIEEQDANWLVNACVHTDEQGDKRERVHQPDWPGEKGMVEGVNRFGCPSVAMFDSGIKPQLDPSLELCMDCDMWIQLYRMVGAPAIRRTPDVVIRMWGDQLSQKLDYAACLERDKARMRKKYGYT